MKCATITLALASIVLWGVVGARAQSVNDTAIEACRTTGLIALKERSATVKDLSFDMDSILVSKANTRVEEIPVRMVVIGDAYLEKRGTGKPQRFVCLIGEKGKVLLTFFMGL